MSLYIKPVDLFSLVPYLALEFCFKKSYFTLVLIVSGNTDCSWCK